jgi:hypothetical protein
MIILEKAARKYDRQSVGHSISRLTINQPHFHFIAFV